jgi:hypothetical protein
LIVSNLDSDCQLLGLDYESAVGKNWHSIPCTSCCGVDKLK